MLFQNVPSVQIRDGRPSHTYSLIPVCGQGRGSKEQRGRATSSGDLAMTGYPPVFSKENQGPRPSQLSGQRRFLHWPLPLSPRGTLICANSVQSRRPFFKETFPSKLVKDRQTLLSFPEVTLHVKTHSRHFM